MEGVYEVAVVGAGVMGSWVAYTLAENGVRTVLLEQFGAGHKRGSSHGHSRVTRRVYPQSHLVAMMKDAYHLWDQLERKTNTKLYIPTGIMVFGEEDCDNELKQVVSALQENALPFQCFSAEEANSRYPGLRLPGNFTCVLENYGGILLADKAVSTLQESFKRSGGDFVEHCCVCDVEPGDVVKLRTEKGTVQAKRVVLTTGAWGKKLLSQIGLYNIPLQPVRTEVLYWKPNNPDQFSSSKFPTFWYSFPSNSAHDLIYGLPCQEYPGLIKICIGHHRVHLEGPDHALLPENKTPYSIERVAQFVGEYFVGVATTPSAYESCIYTDTPDHMPIIDQHPLHPNIVFGVGFSGHGFKLSPVVGKVLYEMSMGIPPSHDLSHFRLSRFKKSKL